MEKSSIKKIPNISVVVIGLNAERDIDNCLNAIYESDFPKENLEVIYVDGGSSDNSIENARNYESVKIIELDHPNPSPGRGRNAGIINSTNSIIQFVDSDSYLHPDWLKTSIEYLRDDIGVVWGILYERFPNKNWYHKVSNIDWGVVIGNKGFLVKEGETTGFGGNVLIKRDVLDKSGNYDETLIAGEEADLSFRIRKNGWAIYRINSLMASHDINLNSFSVYNKRAFKSGYAYAEIGYRYFNNKNKQYRKRIFRILLSGMIPLLLVIAGIIMNNILSFAILALLLVFRNIIKIPLFIKKYKIKIVDSIIYVIHLSYVIYPQLFGLFRFFIGKLTNNPFCNKIIKK